MKKTLILTAHVEHPERIRIDYHAFSPILCADGGYLVAEQLGLTPDLVIGDCDSGPRPAHAETVVLPTEKDMTDSEAAIDLAVSRGLTHITVLGGLGGRLDHTMGNLGILAKYCGKLDHLSFVDGQNEVMMLAPGAISIPRDDFTYLGVISYGGTATGVTLRGVKYPLTDYTLGCDTTLGVSNEITADRAQVSFTGGRLLLIRSRDDR